MGQITIPEIVLRAGNENSNSYIPFDLTDFDGAAGETTTVQIFVNFDETNGSQWSQPAQNAFLEAVEIWEQILVSDVPIRINARFETLGEGVLGAAGSSEFFTNFSSTDPKYREDLFYPSALANKLAGEDLSPTVVDINARFNSNQLFYFGIDGQPGFLEYDFMTVVLHEIGHGLGLFSSIRETPFGNLLVYGFSDGDGGVFPYVYDTFLSNPFLGDFLTELVPAGIPSNTITDFATSFVRWSDNIGVENDAAMGALMEFSIGAFVPGESMNHLSELVLGDELMSSTLNRQQAIHTPGVISNAMLENIGWTSDFTTGEGDDLWIGGFDQYCWESTQGYCNPFESNLIDELNVGDVAYFSRRFEDNGGYTTFDNFEWKFEIIHSEGSYIPYPNGTNLTDHPYAFGLEVPELPESFTWSRNAKNQIRAILTISGTDSDGFFHREKKIIKIDHLPDLPTVQLSNNQEDNCNSVKLTFQSRGAENFIIRYKAQNQLLWNTVNVPAGKLEYTLQGLYVNQYYFFQVDAINEFGTRSSQVHSRKPCNSSIIIEPNPGKEEVLISSQNEMVIENIQIFKNDDPGINLYQEGDGYSSQIQINVTNLPSGLYRVIMTEENGNVMNSTLSIIQ